MTASERPTSSPSLGRASSLACPPSPLWAVLAFAFINSLGSGVVSNGIFFMAKENFGFSPSQNYLLAIIYGLAYIPAAMAIGPLLRRMTAAHGLFNPRLAVATCIVVMAITCWLPWFGQWLAGTPKPPAWTLWALMPIYSACCGLLWPMVESFLSGGRTGLQLRSAIGRFNVSWSSALVIGMLAVSPLAQTQGVLALQLIGVCHILSLVTLIPFPTFPAKHEHHAQGRTHPAVYFQLLALFRWLLPLAYVVLAALIPYLPIATSQLALSIGVGAAIGAVWPASRCLCFLALERWHGWHGRWATPVVGVACLLCGFILAVLAPILLPWTPGLVGLMAGLVIFGTGMATIYAAALYYTMEVGAAEVEAGGLFETLIGTGYVIGPGCGLIAVGLASGGFISVGQREPLMIALVSAVAAIILVFAIRQARRSRVAVA